MSEELLYVNGINGASGTYELPPLTPAELTEAAIRESQTPSAHVKELDHKWQSDQPSFQVIDDLDPLDLAEVGWGVIFTHNADPKIKQALAPLLQHRRAMATTGKSHYYEFEGVKGFRPGDSYLDFLIRQNAGPGPADPERVPYYLLIVGDPETIPYEFQYGLDVQYAVGRLWFEDPKGQPDLGAFTRYAQGVVKAETTAAPAPRRAVFFGVKNPDDPATTQSADLLVGPLAQRLRSAMPAWDVRTLLEAGATKSALNGLFRGGERPALLFTASHGMVFPLGDQLQLRHQGAILCQDWPGPEAWGRKPVPESYYFSADDLDGSAQVEGLIAFQFACYGAGTPMLDDYPHPRLRARPTIAPRSFLARLPQRLLTHENGPALAVVGHVERAWPSSFAWKQAGPQLQAFQSMLKRLFKGIPIGHALDYFNVRYAELTSLLNMELQDIKYGKRPDDLAIAGLWTANNDARGYIILGDPAVRLRTAEVNA
jgi:hypothetical protein